MVVETARKLNAAKVVAELIAEDDSGTSSDEDVHGCGGDNEEAPEREKTSGGSGKDDDDEISIHDQSADIGKLDREGLLELCTMLTAASANVPSTPADGVSDDVATYVDEAIAELADESGEVSFEAFEDWWSKNKRHQQCGNVARTHQQSSTPQPAGGRQQTAGDGSPLSMEDRYAAAQAANIASLASNDDLGCEEAIAAAVAAAEAAVGPEGSQQALPDSSASSSNEPANSAARKDGLASSEDHGMMRAYLQAGAAGIVAAAAAWVAQSSMMSG